jgi:hypothetical protein
MLWDNFNIILTEPSALLKISIIIRIWNTLILIMYRSNQKSKFFTNKALHWKTWRLVLFNSKMIKIKEGSSNLLKVPSLTQALKLMHFSWCKVIFFGLIMISSTTTWFCITISFWVPPPPSYGLVPPSACNLLPELIIVRPTHF